MTASALITGASGQDGRYLTRAELDAGGTVVAAVRDPATAAALVGGVNRVTIIPWNPHSDDAIRDLLSEHRPGVVFNLAAFATGTGMYDDPVAIGDVNGLAVARILEAIRIVDPSIRFVQASSSEMFGRPDHAPQNEHTGFKPRSPYGAAKLYAHLMVGMYRERFGLFACSAILFNHESALRPESFVTRKVTATAARIAHGSSERLRLGDLDARRDWGDAGDTVRAIRMIAAAEQPDDYVVATGQLHSVRDLCDIAFAHVGLDYRDHVDIDPTFVRPPEAVPLVGDATRLRERLGWAPSRDFAALVRAMVDADMDRAREQPRKLKDVR